MATHELIQDHPDRHNRADRAIRAGRDDRGSVSLYMVVAVVVMFLAIGLVVDGGGKVRALQRAEAVAAEAARAGGQQIKKAPAVQGQGAQVDAAAARRAALTYLSQAGVKGTVTILGGTRLRVNTTTTYSPVFLDLVGLGGEMTTHGSAEVRLVTGVDGVEVR